MIDGVPLVGAGEWVIGVSDYGVAGALGLHVALVAFAQNDHAFARKLARSPDPVVLVIANSFRQAIFRPEEIDGAGIAVIVGENRGLALFFRRKGAVVGGDGLCDLLPPEHVGIKLREF